MRPEDICLSFRFHNEDLRIDRFLENNLRYCNCFVALDDRSSSDVVYQKLYAHPKCAAIIRKSSNANFSESADREALYAMTLSTKKKYQLYMDVDEIISNDFECEMPSIPECDMVWFRFLYMYPDERHYVTSPIYAERYFPMIVKTSSHYRFKRPEDIAALHSSRIPTDRDISDAEMTSVRASSPLYHFNMCSGRIREKRYEFYRQRDPGLVYQQGGYEHLIDPILNRSYINPSIINPAPQDANDIVFRWSVWNETEQLYARLNRSIKSFQEHISRKDILFIVACSDIEKMSKALVCKVDDILRNDHGQLFRQNEYWRKLCPDLRLTNGVEFLVDTDIECTCEPQFLWDFIHGSQSCLVQSLPLGYSRAVYGAWADKINPSVQVYRTSILGMKSGYNFSASLHAYFVESLQMPYNWHNANGAIIKAIENDIIAGAVFEAKSDCIGNGAPLQLNYA